MLVSLTELRNYYMKGRDGEVGRIEDLCSREDEWIVRYVVVDMEDLGREALLLSAYLGPGEPHTHTHTVSADIRRDAIVHSPIIASATEPITPKFEQRLKGYYEQYSR